MDNVSKALEMAAGVLVAILIMTLVAYFFSNIGELPKIQDDNKTKAQLEAFNKEFEVYSKKGMYGVDVISCLNKAKNNNQKYVEGKAFLTGKAYGKDYLIDVYFNLKTDLEESIEVRHFDKQNHEVINYEEVSGYTLKDTGLLTKDIEGAYTAFKSSNTLKTTYNTLDSDSKIPGCIVKNGGSKPLTVNGSTKNYYSLLNDTQVDKLLKFSNMLRIEVRNKSNIDLDKWSSVLWKTALYSFKTKKFKCDDIKYSDATGRVNEIYFSEL